MPDEAGGPTVDLWSLAEDVVVEPGDREDELVLTGRWGAERVTAPQPVVEEALRRMELGPVLLANLEPRTDDTTGRDDWYCLSFHLERLSHLIVRTLGVDDLAGPLLSAMPVSPVARFALARLPGRRPVRLPSGASLTVGRDGVSVQSPGSSYRVLVHRPEAVWVLGRLAWPVTPDQVSAALSLPAGVTERIMDYLAAAGLTAEAGDEHVPSCVLPRSDPGPDPGPHTGVAPDSVCVLGCDPGCGVAAPS
ncbi:NADH oxidase [Streptomyces achromogenes]|uniref:NADH oxidase n=1 Tax=Streptomyces achromogenes TaxID=67255 RepID=UPI0036B41E83